MPNRTSFATATMVALALTGCASTEGVADSAISTNLEFEKSQNNTLLLNVVRASLRRPPVYHTLQSVTGSVRPSGDATLAVPFGVNVSNANSLTFAVKGNEGPKTTMAPLDTQEFYQGIMAPIKTTTIDFYVQQGYPRELLYNLFFGRIELRSEGGVVVIRNYPGRDEEVDNFQRLVSRLVELGFTTKPSKGDGTQYGPLRTAAQVESLAATGAAATAGLVVTKSSETICVRRKKNKCVKTEPLYRVAKPQSAPSADICFRPPPDALLKDLANLPNTCAAASVEDNKVTLKWKHIAGVLKQIDQDRKARAEKAANGKAMEFETFASKLCPACNDEANVELSFTVRSVDGIIYYLGEVTRRSLYPEDEQDARPLGYHSPGGKQIEPCRLVDGKWQPECHAIFWVDLGAQPTAAVAAIDYEGSSFSVPGPVARSGAPRHPGERSSQVFGIVAQLMALNKSAKDQPTTSILNVVAP